MQRKVHKKAEEKRGFHRKNNFEYITTLKCEKSKGRSAVRHIDE